MRKKSIEIAFGTLAILIIVLVVLIGIISYYFLVYSKTTSSQNQIVISISNQTNNTVEIIKNMTNISKI